MHLKEFILDTRKITYADAARELDVSKQCVLLWVHGKAIPRREEVQKIYEWSDGQVTPNDFYNLQADGVSPSAQSREELSLTASSQSGEGGTATAPSLSPATGVQVRDSLHPGHAFDLDLAGVA